MRAECAAAVAALLLSVAHTHGARTATDTFTATLPTVTEEFTLPTVTATVTSTVTPTPYTPPPPTAAPSEFPTFFPTFGEFGNPNAVTAYPTLPRGRAPAPLPPAPMEALPLATAQRRLLSWAARGGGGRGAQRQQIRGVTVRTVWGFGEQVSCRDHSTKQYWLTCGLVLDADARVLPATFRAAVPVRVGEALGVRRGRIHNVDVSDGNPAVVTWDVQNPTPRGAATPLPWWMVPITVPPRRTPGATAAAAVATPVPATPAPPYSSATPVPPTRLPRRGTVPPPPPDDPATAAQPPPGGTPAPAQPPRAAGGGGDVVAAIARSDGGDDDDDAWHQQWWPWVLIGAGVLLLAAAAAAVAKRGAAAAPASASFDGLIGQQLEGTGRSEPMLAAPSGGGVRPY